MGNIIGNIIGNVIGNTMGNKTIKYKDKRIFDDKFRSYNKNILKYCTNTIQELKYKTKKFYIGVTHNPDERIVEHIRNKKGNVMYILTETNTIPRAADLEKKLIMYFKKEKNIMNDIKISPENPEKITQGGGGEGIIHKKNYVYVMLFK